jgi:hypothetical protein
MLVSRGFGPGSEAGLGLSVEAAGFSGPQAHGSWPFEVERKALRLGLGSPQSEPAQSGHSSPPQADSLLRGEGHANLRSGSSGKVVLMDEATPVHGAFEPARRRPEEATDRAVAPASSGQDLDGAWPRCNGRRRPGAPAPSGGGPAPASSPGTRSGPFSPTARQTRSPSGPGSAS